MDKYWTLKHNGWNTKLARYCDDFVVLVRNDSIDRYMDSLQSMLSKLKLSLSEEKTRIAEAEKGFDFLGTRLVRKPSRKNKNRFFCYCFPSPKAMKSVRQKIKRRVGRNYQDSLEEKVKDLNPLLRGWANYYNWMNSGEHFHKIERYGIQKLYRGNYKNTAKGAGKAGSTPKTCIGWDYTDFPVPYATLIDFACRYGVLIRANHRKAV